MDKGMVDRNGMRGGAGVSAAALLVAFVLDVWGVVPVLAVVLGIGALRGPRSSPLGVVYRLGKRSLKLQIPVEPEPEAPPRFAQLLGFVFLSLATGAFAADLATLGWVFTLLVAGLQGLLAGTGICVGCEIYLYSKRFAAKGA